MSWSVTVIVQNLPFDCCRIKKNIYIYLLSHYSSD